MEGTISLGVYDHAGKLVRVLHREDAIAEFTAGHDALETIWDGNDADGHILPNGKYSARGYLVGALKVEGIDYFFNDWVTDEKSPHLRSLGQLWMESGELRIEAELAGGKMTAFVCDQMNGELRGEVSPIAAVHCNQIGMLPDLIDCAAGMDGTTWLIDSLANGGPRAVKQLSRSHDVLRRLDYVADDPQPERIEASKNSDKIFLLEKNHLLQRFRGLVLLRTTNANGGAVSDWKSLFERKIIGHQDFTIRDGKPVAAAGAGSGLEEVTQDLRPNPLQHDVPGKAQIAVGLDDAGSYLKTTDGLPLHTISETPHLSRALIARSGEEGVDVFQDDGAVVEQFRITHLAQMIAFDCGDFELK